MFINKTKCKKYLLEKSQEFRNGYFTRVGADVYEELDLYMRNKMDEIVRRHPACGKTIKLRTSTRSK